jgi:hypothetical protein
MNYFADIYWLSRPIKFKIKQLPPPPECNRSEKTYIFAAPLKVCHSGNVFNSSRTVHSSETFECKTRHQQNLRKNTSILFITDSARHVRITVETYLRNYIVLPIVGWIPGRSNRFSSSTKHPDRLWGPPSLLMIGYHGLFPRL